MIHITSQQILSCKQSIAKLQAPLACTEWSSGCSKVGREIISEYVRCAATNLESGLDYLLVMSFGVLVTRGNADMVKEANTNNIWSCLFFFLYFWRYADGSMK